MNSLQEIRKAGERAAALGDAADLIKADPGQIEQVVMNLVINARDAMRNGGVVTIRTGTAHSDDSLLTAMGSPLAAARYSAIAIADTGCGMSPETRARLFEPFFTTKPAGEDTGLGLATVYGIVTQSGGHVAVESEPNQGATFTVYLPAIGDDAGRATTELQPAARGRGETILLVEDEEAVRQFVRTLLEDAGYDVVEASSPAEALCVAADATRRIALVLTDVIMPGKSGPATVEDIRTMRPGIKVCYMSGYADEAIVKAGVFQPGTPFIEKPFTGAALRRKVREALDV